MMGEKGLSDSEQHALGGDAQQSAVELDGVASSDHSAHVDEAGAHVIASLLLGNDPIAIGSHYGRTLRARIVGTPWEWLYEHLKGVQLASRCVALDDLLSRIPNGYEIAGQIGRAGTVICAPAAEAQGRCATFNDADGTPHGGARLAEPVDARHATRSSNEPSAGTHDGERAGETHDGASEGSEPATDHVGLAGAFLIACLLLGIDPDRAQGEHPQDLHAVIKGTRWEIVYNLFFRAREAERPFVLAKWLAEQPDRCSCDSRIQHQLNVLLNSTSSAQDFVHDNHGVALKTQGNIRLALKRMGCVLEHDVFADRLLCNGGHMGDAEVTHLYLQTEELFGFRTAKDYFWMVVEEAARSNPRHPIRDYLARLRWDGTPRLDTWLATYLGAPDTKYTRTVGAIVLVAAVRRVRQPGCKFDEMLVLESGQGTAKSTALSVLSVRDEWFSDDLPLSADTKRLMEALAGRWIVEAGELRGMRKGDVEHLKSFLSRRVDRARLAYGRLTTEAQRQCVIIGTTNSDRYLRDSTGNRRYWPVAVGEIDVAAIRRDRDQLWAEAAIRETEGMSIRLAPELWPVAGGEQEDRRIEDPMFERLEKHLAGQEGKIPASRAWDITGVPPGQRQQEDNARLGDAMKKLGYRRDTMRFGGSPEKGYWRGNKETEIVIVGVEQL
jgi:hypothetical protein